MFQLGSLVVLCSLLTGTSASTLGNIGSDQNNLNIMNSVCGNDPQNMKLNLGLLQKTTDWLLAKNTILGAFNMLELDNLKVLSSQNVLRLQNNEFRILDLQAGLSSDGKGMDMNMPLIVNASLFLPRFGSRGDFSVSFSITTSLTVKTDAQTGLPILAIGKCRIDAEKVTFSLLDRTKAYANLPLKVSAGILNFVAEEFVINEICPMFQSLLSNLNINLIQDLLSNPQRGQLPVSI
ncbi:parotid secretory protein [Cricetulus griseus]|uniref:Parotid secretory protein n=1 Tax=Cricetulus griseus TaxID=10029 RepID=A0A061I1U3_CRIGR|nr:parotid secretory protein [Cricetulus griseus]